MSYPDPYWRLREYRDHQLQTERTGVIADRAAAVMAQIDAHTSALHTLYSGPRLPRVEQRDITALDITDRLITAIAVPYDQPATVNYRGGIWTEVFDRGAFAHGADPGRRVSVNRDHDRSRTVGKVVSFDTTDPRGLVVGIRIAQTPLGDETLALAAEDMLSASVGFAVPKDGERLDRTTMTRRVLRAHLDHLALVAQPAYDGAIVTGVA